MCIATLFNKENIYKLLNLELFMLHYKINRTQYCVMSLEKNN